MTWLDDVRSQLALRAPSARGYVAVNCPACMTRANREDRQRKVSVNVNNGWLRCWRCDWRSRLPELSDGSDLLPHDDGWEDVDDEDPWVELVSDFNPLAGDRSLSLAPFREYLARRGVDEIVCAESRVGAATTGAHAGRLIFPVWSSHGLAIGWVGRAIKPRVFPPYYLPTGMARARAFFADHLLGETTHDPLIVTEGPFDALRHWGRAVACFGKPTPKQLERLATVRRDVVVVLDGDAWQEGLAAAQTLRGTYKRRATALVLPAGSDLGSLPAHEVWDSVRWCAEKQQDGDMR